MTSRYDVLIASIAASNLFIVQMFLIAFAAVIAYPILAWTPAWMRRHAEHIYLASLLGLFFATVFLGGS